MGKPPRPPEPADPAEGREDGDEKGGPVVDPRPVDIERAVRYPRETR